MQIGAGSHQVSDYWGGTCKYPKGRSWEKSNSVELGLEIVAFGGDNTLCVLTYRALGTVTDMDTETRTQRSTFICMFSCSAL